jgi:hypothetical protein
MPCDFRYPNKKARSGYVKDAMDELIMELSFDNKEKEEDEVKAMCLEEVNDENAKPKSKYQRFYDILPYCCGS